MKNEFSIRITEEGDVDAIYQDGLAEALDAETKEVRRASNVEFEEMPDGRKGWSVRSAHDPSLAIRVDRGCYGVAKLGELALFETREKALEWEVKLFWHLTYRPEPKRGPETVYLSAHEFDQLPETPTAVDRKWKHCLKNEAGKPPDWYMGEYVQDPGATLLGVKWRKIAIVERKEG